MRLRVGFVGADVPVVELAAAVRHAEMVDVRILPGVVHLLLIPVGLLGSAADGGMRARVVVVLGDARDVDPADPREVAEALGADLVVVAAPVAEGGAAATVLRRVVDALVDGAVLGDALAAGLGDLTPLAGDDGLLRHADLGTLLDPFRGPAQAGAR